MKKILSFFYLSLCCLMVCCFSGCKDDAANNLQDTSNASQDENSFMDSALGIKNLVEEAEKQFNSKNFDSAIDFYTETLKINPEDPYLHSCRAEAKFRKGDLEGAIEDYGKAIELGKKQCANFYEGRAKVYIEKNNYELAEEDYKQALSMEPNLDVVGNFFVEKYIKERVEEKQNNKN